MVTGSGVAVPRDDGRSNRGQLLVITGIALAVLLVLLALALNTAVMGGIHADGAGDTNLEERNAVEFTKAVERGLPGLFPGVNEGNMAADAREEKFEQDLARWNEILADGYARDATRTNVELAQAFYESDIVQDDADRRFRSAESDDTWILAEEVTDVEEFTIAVYSPYLNATSDCASADECFTIEVSDAAGNTWELFAYTSEGEKETVEIDVRPSDGTSGSCTIEGNEPLTVNVTGGTFEHEDCSDEEFTSFLEDGDLEPPYTIRYHRGDLGSGTYQMRVNGTVDADHFNDPEDSPWLSSRMIGAIVDVEYRSSTVHYGTSVEGWAEDEEAEDEDDE